MRRHALYFSFLWIATTSTSYAASDCTLVSFSNPTKEIACSDSKESHFPAIICCDIDNTPCQHVTTKNDLQNSPKKCQTSNSTIGLFTARAHRGGKFLNKKNQFTGAPYGTILRPAKQLIFTPIDNDAKTIVKFTLQQENNKQTIFTKENAKFIKIPSTLFSHGTTYRYKVETKNTTYQGLFTITSKMDQADFNRELSDLQSTTKHRSAELFTSALLAKNWGYSYDFIALLETAKQSLVKGN